MATPTPQQDLTMFGDVIQGVGGLMQGFEIQDAYDYNAGILDQQAEQVMVAAGLQEEEIGTAESEMLGTQKAMYAKAGVTMSGSPTDVALQTATNFEFDKLVTDYNAKVKESYLQSEANMSKMYGKEAATQGMFKMGSSLLSAGKALL